MRKFLGSPIHAINPKALRSEISSSDAKVGDASPNFRFEIGMALKRGSQNDSVFGVNPIAYVVSVKHALQERNGVTFLGKLNGSEANGLCGHGKKFPSNQAAKSRVYALGRQ